MQQRYTIISASPYSYQLTEICGTRRRAEQIFDESVKGLPEEGIICIFLYGPEGLIDQHIGKSYAK